jgi:hypothetical protein
MPIQALIQDFFKGRRVVSASAVYKKILLTRKKQKQKIVLKISYSLQCPKPVFFTLHLSLSTSPSDFIGFLYSREV